MKWEECSAPLTRMIMEDHFRRWYFSGDLINVKAKGIETPRGVKGKENEWEEGGNKQVLFILKQTNTLDASQTKPGQGGLARWGGGPQGPAGDAVMDSDSFHGAPTAKANPPLHLCITLLTEHFPVLFHIVA